MAIIKITIDQLPALSEQYAIMDVRSPREYSHAHIPGAYSLPLFTDAQRKIIGTAYKQESREKAIKIGLDFFGPNMTAIIENAERIVLQHQPLSSLNPKSTISNAVVVHCWRGGMRSSAVAWLLNFYGYDVYVLEGGYKSYRYGVLAQFDLDYNIKILGGYTGSGKTEILKVLESLNQTTIDLEALASHKGSAFGAIGQYEQPTQEMFENMLADALEKNRSNTIWLEDESQRIGRLTIPHSIWKNIRRKPVYFIEIPFEERLLYIIKEYGIIEQEELINGILRIHKRLGPLETKNSIAFLKQDNIEDCFRILLNYYDKCYLKALRNRENLDSLLNKIDCVNMNTITNSEKLLSCAFVNS